MSMLLDCEVSRQDKIACLKREVAMRERLYANWVAVGKMTKPTAERELLIMQAILKDYQHG